MTGEAPYIAITCGGTGGHLFPGLAIGRALLERGCKVGLLVSAKAVDQLATKGVTDFEIVTVPAEALKKGAPLNFLRGSSRAYAMARALYKERRPAGALGMGSFTSIGPMVAAKSLGIRTFLHESNALPGKANRYLAPFVDQIFVGFPEARALLRNPRIEVTGTPVREEVAPMDPSAARMTLGLDPKRPTILIMGGSQGAQAVNELLIKSAPELLGRWPELQFIHITGAAGHDAVKAAYTQAKARALVAPFLTEIHFALSAASVAVMRAGASSMAEVAALRLPTIFIPLPSAADDHQTLNAHAFVKTGAALSLQQAEATPARLMQKLAGLIESQAARGFMQQELDRWQFPNPAQTVADRIVEAIGWEPRDPEEEMLLKYQAQLKSRAATPKLENLPSLAHA